MPKKYKTMSDAAKALESEGIDICSSEYKNLSTEEQNTVLEVMSEAKTFRHNEKKGLNRGEDFFNRMEKYGSCDVD